MHPQMSAHTTAMCQQLLKLMLQRLDLMMACYSRADHVPANWDLYELERSLQILLHLHANVIHACTQGRVWVGGFRSGCQGRARQ